MSSQRKRSWGWDETELSLEPASQDPLVPQSPWQIPSGNSVILARVSLLLCFYPLCPRNLSHFQSYAHLKSVYPFLTIFLSSCHPGKSL